MNNDKPHIVLTIFDMRFLIKIMEIYLVKQLDNTFKVAYDSDYENLKKIKPLAMIKCEISQPRNIKFHRKFFALIKMVYQNQERYNNIEHLRKDLIISAGFYDSRVNLYGEEINEAKSISFASMKQIEFDDLYNRVLDEIVKHFHFDKQLIIDNIEQYF